MARTTLLFVDPPLSWRMAWPALWLAAACMLSACGGGGAAPAPVDPHGPAGPLTLARPGELVALARLRLGSTATGANFSDGLAVAAVTTPSNGSASASATMLRSTTLVQEAGVDEPDLMASRGDHVYTLAGTPDAATTPRLRVRSHPLQADGSATPGASLDLEAGDGAGSFAPQGLLLAPAAQRLAVLSEWTRHSPIAIDCVQRADCLAPLALPMVFISHREVRLSVLRAPADGSLAHESTLAIQGRLVGSRLVGQRLVLVTLHEPALPVAADASQAERQAALARLAAADLLPTVRVNGAAAAPLLAETDCYLPPSGSTGTNGLPLTTITVLDLSDPGLARSSRCIAGHSDTLYLSPTSLYLAASRAQAVMDGGVLRYTGALVTDIHKVALTTLQWHGSGQVDGHLGWDEARKPYRLSEHEGTLRVLSFTGNTGWVSVQDSAERAASPATLTLLREAPEGGVLQRVATLPNSRRPQALGKPGEQVYAVRFLGERGYLVTFRRTDPLYVLDLSDPTDPRSVGELQTPGFADHLFPLPGGLLLGTGRDADANGVLGGLRLALLDVNDPAAPREAGNAVFGDRASYSTLDHTPHGLALRVDGNTVKLALPAVLAADGGMNYNPTLLRLAVDTQARTLSVAPSISTTGAPGAMSLWDQRVMLSGDKLLHLVGGELVSRTP